MKERSEYGRMTALGDEDTPPRPSLEDVPYTMRTSGPRDVSPFSVKEIAILLATLARGR